MTEHQVAEIMALADAYARCLWRDEHPASSIKGSHIEARARLESALREVQGEPRKPLTDAEITDVWRAWPRTSITSAARAIEFARAIESAHHIEEGRGDSSVSGGRSATLADTSDAKRE